MLFVARIVLKDFRDREGDALYGKPTLLLRFGKDATCAVSLAALLAGNCLLLGRAAPAARRSRSCSSSSCWRSR